MEGMPKKIGRPKKNPPTLDQALEAAKSEMGFRKFERLAFVTPHPKQLEFFAAGSEATKRMLTAGNQQGKSEAGGMEAAYHATGLYPKDWTGYRFKRATRGWCAGESSTDVRDIQQAKLCGPAGLSDMFGTGLIPKRLLLDHSMARGATDAFDTLQVRHVTGDISTIKFKSYEQGREKFQGEPVDWIWLDEEPGSDIFVECIARTVATNGIIWATMTPLKGVTDLMRTFRTGGDQYKIIKMGIKDALHIPEDRRAAIIAGFPAHQRKSRVDGEPFLGSGAVFEDIDVNSLLVPLRLLRGGEVQHEKIGVIQTAQWRKLWAVDFGIDHPFAAVLLMHDADNDVIYVMADIRITGGTPAIHASAMKRMCSGVRVTWPHDGNARESNGEQLMHQYKKEELDMLPTHATFPTGGYSTEAGIMEMTTRMQQGRFKVAANCVMFQEEFASYHRKDGLIVKEHDDILSATRIGVISIRHARSGAWKRTAGEGNPHKAGLAKGVDHTPWGA